MAYALPELNNLVNGPVIPSGPPKATQYQGSTPPPGATNYQAPKQNGGWYNGVQYWENGQGPANSQSLPLQATPSFQPPDFEALVRPAIEGLENYISTLQGQFPGTIEGIDKDLANKTNQLNASIGAQTTTIGNAKTEQASAQENAANEARRQNSEINQGIQARYGATTGTGQFASEIVGAQTSRNMANIRTTGMQLMKQLDDKLLQVQEIGRLTLEDLNTQAERQKTEAKDRLDTQVAQIRAQIGETQSRKAELFASAYQNFKNTVAQVNAQHASFQQQLYMQQLAAQQQLEAAKQRASGIASTATPQDLRGLIEQAQIAGNAGYDVTGNLSSRGAGSLSFTTPKKDTTGTGGISIDANGNLVIE